MTRKTNERWAAAERAEQEDLDRRAREAAEQEWLDAASLAIDEYYNGDREWAVRWLENAAKANKDLKA